MNSLWLAFSIFLVSLNAVEAGSSASEAPSPCHWAIENASPDVLTRPGMPVFSETEWVGLVAQLKDCVADADICVVNFNFERSQSSVKRAKTFDAYLSDEYSSDWDVLFAAVQIRDFPNLGCFMAQNGFSGAEPWYSEGWLLDQRNGKLLAHFDIEKMEQVFDVGMGAAQKEIALALRDAYYWHFKKEGQESLTPHPK